MARTVKIGEAAYERMKEFATPMEDDFESTLIKIMDLADRQLDKRKHLPVGARTPWKEYELPIMEALYRMKSRAPVKQVMESVYESMKDRLNDVDNGRSRGGQARWYGSAHAARRAMIKNGLLKHDAPTGIWELSEDGVRVVEDAAAGREETPA